MNLTKLAKGKPCQIRLVGICNRDDRTVVACHYRLIGYSGAGLKMDDIFIAFGCSSCHDAVDGRMKTDLTRAELHEAHAEGIFRTQAWLLEHHYLKVAA